MKKKKHKNDCNILKMTFTSLKKCVFQKVLKTMTFLLFMILIRTTYTAGSN